MQLRSANLVRGLGMVYSCEYEVSNLAQRCSGSTPRANQEAEHGPYKAWWLISFFPPPHPHFSAVMILLV